MKTEYGHCQQTGNVHVYDASRWQAPPIMTAQEQIDETNAHTHIYSCAPLTNGQEMACDVKRPRRILVTQKREYVT